MFFLFLIVSSHFFYTIEKAKGVFGLIRPYHGYLASYHNRWYQATLKDQTVKLYSLEEEFDGHCTQKLSLEHIQELIDLQYRVKFQDYDGVILKVDFPYLQVMVLVESSNDTFCWDSKQGLVATQTLHEKEVEQLYLVKKQLFPISTLETITYDSLEMLLTELIPF